MYEIIKKIIILLLMVIQTIIICPNLYAVSKDNTDEDKWYEDTVYPYIEDKELQECLDDFKNQTTYGMVECFKISKIKWENKIDSIYNKMLLILNDSVKQNFINSQTQWQEYIKVEKKLIISYYTDFLEGSMYRIAAISAVMKMYRDRYIALESYYSDLPKNENQNPTTPKE